MSLFQELRKLEEEGIDLIDVLGHDRYLESPEILREVIHRLRHADENLYAELLHHLTYRRFRAEEAEALWQGIMEHKRGMERALGREVRFRVAALEHLTERGILEGARLLARPEFESILSYVNIDEVSGVHSRRYFNERLAEEISRARRYGKPLSFLLLDLDDFKRVNDAFGHVAGDALLRRVGRLLQDTTRQADAVCRFGGDEFAILLPETGSLEAMTTAERIRVAVGSIPFAAQGETLDGDGASRGLSFSIGGACFPASCEDAEELIALADQMCLEAKRAGKNCVRIAEPGDALPVAKFRET